MTDDDVLKIAYNKIGRINSKLIYYIDKPENLELKQYLLNRYNDIPENLFSYREVLWRILYNIEKRPVCEYCGSFNIKFTGFKRKKEPDAFPNGYKRTCCKECSIKLWQKKSEQTILNKYKVKNVFQSDIIKNKIKETCINRYGVENPSQLSEIQEKVENTTIKHYGVKRYLISQEGKEKYKNTCINRYGVENPSQSEYIKEKKKNTTFKNYGVTNPSYNFDIRKQRLKTKRKNGTFTTSAPENKVFSLLLEKYPDTIRQYSSEKYPYMCDFYIPSTDTYIEYNGNWTHGGHPFDANNPNDIALLESWKEKHTPYYDSAIDVWTCRDPQKREIAKKSNIKYIEFWSMSEVINFLENEGN